METNEPIDFQLTPASILAQNPDTPAEELAELARHPQVMVRYYVAWNRNTTPATLAELSNDQYVWTRDRDARRRTTPTEVLVKLAQDHRLEVRQGVAANPRIPPAIKMWLQAEQYGGMTLREFLEASNATS